MVKALARLLTSTTDGYGPVGSDTGADTLAFYRDWRKRRRRRETFLPWLLRVWELRDDGWEESDEARVQEQLERDGYQQLVGDDTAIAFAFAQLIVDGAVADADRRSGLLAIERQGMACVMAARGWDDPPTRRRALAAMRRALTAASTA